MSSRCADRPESCFGFTHTPVAKLEAVRKQGRSRNSRISFKVMLGPSAAVRLRRGRPGAGGSRHATGSPMTTGARRGITGETTGDVAGAGWSGGPAPAKLSAGDPVELPPRAVPSAPSSRSHIMVSPSKAGSSWIRSPRVSDQASGPVPRGRGCTSRAGAVRSLNTLLTQRFPVEEVCALAKAGFSRSCRR